MPSQLAARPVIFHDAGPAAAYDRQAPRKSRA